MTLSTAGTPGLSGQAPAVWVFVPLRNAITATSSSNRLTKLEL